MRTLRFLASIHPSVYAIVILIASIHPVYAQTATLSTVRSFGSVGLGSTSSPSNVTLRNGSSTVALLVSSIATTGDFAQTNNCGSSLAARGSCVITLTFLPTAVGSRTGTLTVTDNANPTTQKANLSGTGVAPASITPASRNYATTNVGTTTAAKIFTVSNKGTAAMAFTVTPSTNFTEIDNCASVAGGGTCTINAAFAPTAIGALSGTISVSYAGAGSPLSVSLTGTGVAPVTITPATRAFGNQAVGSVSAARTFTVANKSASPMAFTVTPSANFTETDNCGSVVGGASCTINAVFAPIDAGALSGTISVSYAGAGSPLSVGVTGTGLAPVTITPATRAFGNVAVGSPSAAATFTVANKSASPMAFAISPSANFSETDNCASVAGGASCTINAVFTPAALGVVNGTFAISYSGVGSPMSVTASGTGVSPLTMTPASQAFGNIPMGTKSPNLAFVVTNGGTVAQPLTITTSAPFSQTNTCGASLAGKASCTINAAFSPTTTDASTGAISVSFAGVGSPLTGALTGTGTSGITITPALLAFNTTQRVGVATAAQTVSLRNRGTAALAIQSIVASPADYTQTNTCPASLAVNASCNINVIFNPHVTGSIPGTITVTDSAIGSPQVVALSGGGALTNLRSVAITPATSSFPKGTQVQFKATATYSNGVTGDVSAISTWTSLNAAVLAIDNVTGLATGVTAGNTSITVAVTGSTVTATRAMTVAPPAITSLTLSPSPASVAPAATLAYSASATYSDGTTGVPPMSALVLSSDNVGIATIANTGVATGINGGVAYIKATSGAVSSPLAQLTVTGPTLQTITITPNLPAIAKGGTQQFTATGNYSDASTKDLSAAVLWSSNSANLTITPQGLATGAVVGSATVTASWSGGVVSGTMNATVISSELASIAVTPASISVGIGAQQQYTAMGTYGDGNSADITNQVTWASSTPAVVGITTSGFATALGTSTTAIQITATLGPVISPPAYFSADPTLARVCPDASIDMKVLVVTNGKTEADFPAITQILDYVGTPYDVFDSTVTPGGFTASMLSDGACHGYYQGVIMSIGGYIYTVPGADVLASYEKTFKVRQVNWFTSPGSDFGLGAAVTTTNPGTDVTAHFTPAAAAIFPHINIATPLTISSATVYGAAPGGTGTALMVDNAGNVLSALQDFGDGRQYLTQTFDSNQYLKHDLVLAYDLLNWVTKGVFLGDYHIYAAAQVDDFFINDAEWTVNTPCTDPITHDRTVGDAPSLGNYRLKYADMVALTNWQNGLQNDPMLKGFKLTLAFNGVGTVGNPDWTGLPMPGITNTAAVTASNPNGVVDDLVYNLASYEKFYHWITHTFDHPNTLNGLCKTDVKNTTLGCGDADNPAVDSIDLEILTNLYVAGNPNGLMLDLDASDTTPPAGATGGLQKLTFTDFDPRILVSPGVTGLNDPVVPQYLAADGIQYAVSDTSVTTQTNNGPNPSPNVGIPNSFAPSIYEVPRYPNDVYFNAATWQDDQAEFQCIYQNYVEPGAPVGTAPKPFPPYNAYTAPQILDYTSETFVINMLKGDMDPQMFHQPNLHAYDGTNSMISDVYNQTFSKYKSLYKLPVLSWTIDQLAEGMKARNAYNKSGATGTLVGVGTASPSITVEIPAANPGAVIPVTGLTSAGSELYGGTNISHIQINQGQSITLPLQ